MNKISFKVALFAVALALVFGLGVNTVLASDSYNVAHPGQADLFGVDEAHTGILAVDADRGPAAPQLNTYGLMGDWSNVR